MNGFREINWIGLLAATTLGFAAVAHPSLAETSADVPAGSAGAAKAPAQKPTCTSSVVVTEGVVVVTATRQCAASVVIADGEVVVTASRTPSAGATTALEPTAGAREPISLAEGGSLVRTSNRP